MSAGPTSSARRRWPRPSWPPLPAAASADALTYADGDNVWIASPDGAVKRALTADGKATDYYAFPSLDDAGNVVAIKGYSTTRAIVVLRPNGTRAINVMPWQTSNTRQHRPELGPREAHDRQPGHLHLPVEPRPVLALPQRRARGALLAGPDRTRRAIRAPP